MTDLRPDLALISDWVTPGARVLDLGCGDGTLLVHLRQTRGIAGYGLEIDPDKLAKCIEAGVNVIQTDLDAGLSEFGAGTFDYVIMTQTLQATHYPARLMDEMLRIGRQGIITFPNFGHWYCRARLALAGLMPISRALPYPWHTTPNIHLCTVKDFERLCAGKGVRILERAVVDHAHRSKIGTRLLPNLLGEIAVYRFQHA